jgi:hypothetical protein
MDTTRFGVREGEHVPAEKVVPYLRGLIEEGGVGECVRINTRVEVVERVDDGGWKVFCTEKGGESESEGTTTENRYIIHTAKLVLATGLASQPSMQRIPTAPDFLPLVIHSYDFPRAFNDMVKPSSRTLVVGGGKSAWDVAYACATQPNATVTMLIRPDGNGPIYMAPTHVTPLGLWLEKLVFTRFFGFMSPCPWAEMGGVEGWARTFLHGTWLGRKIVGAFWQILGDEVVKLNKLDRHPETKKLRPWRGGFETGNALSILNYPTDWFELVRQGKIRVVIGEIELGTGNSVILKNGERVDVDAVVCATGWESGTSIKFVPEGLERELGFPTKMETDTEGAGMIGSSEDEIYERYPFMKTRDTSRVYHPDPKLRYMSTSDPKQQPYRLHRFLVPPSDLHRRSIGFAGALMSLGNTSCAYLQSLWLAAYFDGTLTLPDIAVDQLKYEMYRDTQYCALRNAMGYGNKYPDLVFDSLPYFDVLMRDLGLEGKRKGTFLGIKNWGAECFRSYGPEDYRGLVDDWKKRVECGGEDKKNI